MNIENFLLRCDKPGGSGKIACGSRGMAKKLLAGAWGRMGH